MLLSFVYLAFTSLLKLVVRRRRSDVASEVELIVIRHQAKVLRRQVERPRLQPADRALLAALARVLPRERRLVLLVTPQTVLRLHREVVRRKWAQPRQCGRPPIAREARELSCGWHARTLRHASQASTPSNASELLSVDARAQISHLARRRQRPRSHRPQQRIPLQNRRVLFCAAEFAHPTGVKAPVR
jgi:hypothetical protein